MSNERQLINWDVKESGIAAYFFPEIVSVIKKITEDHTNARITSRARECVLFIESPDDRDHRTIAKLVDRLHRAVGPAYQEWRVNDEELKRMKEDTWEDRDDYYRESYERRVWFMKEFTHGFVDEHFNDTTGSLSDAYQSGVEAYYGRQDDPEPVQEVEGQEELGIDDLI